MASVMCVLFLSLFIRLFCRRFMRLKCLILPSVMARFPDPVSFCSIISAVVPLVLRLVFRVSTPSKAFISLIMG